MADVNDCCDALHELDKKVSVIDEKYVFINAQLSKIEVKIDELVDDMRSVRESASESKGAAAMRDKAWKILYTVIMLAAGFGVHHIFFPNLSL